MAQNTMANKSDGLSRITAVMFDVYGTILNWEPEIADFLESWCRTNGVADTHDELLTIYDQVRQPLQDQRPALRYPEVLRRTLDTMGKELGIGVSSIDRATFGGLAARHRPFDDSVAALDELRARGMTIAAVTNVDDASFAEVTRRHGISFDVVVTAERVGAYKPDPAHFWAALSDLLALGIAMENVLHVAQSRRADLVVANAIGLTSVWVNRPGHVFGRTGRGAENAIADFQINNLTELPSLLKA